MSVMLCTCHGYQCLFNLIHRTILDCRDAIRTPFSREGQRRAQREVLRRAAASGQALPLKLLLRAFAWSDEDVTHALFAAASAHCACAIALARPRTFQVSGPWAVLGAVQAENVDALRGLLEAGVAPDQPIGSMRQTPLHMAAACRKCDCAQLLLLCGIDPNPRNINGETPLHRAATHGRAALVWLLLYHGGASVDARCRRLQTPLHRAALRGHPRCAEVLLDMRANAAARDITGATPLHLAAAAPHASAVLRTLLRRGADPEAQTNSGRRPVHYAAANGKYKNVRLLVDAGADINARTTTGNTVLHIAAASCSSARCVEELARCGADVHARDRRRLTPLHVAAAHGRGQVLRELLRLGARTDLQAQRDFTPLMIAMARRDQACVRALAEAGTDEVAAFRQGHYALMGPSHNPSDPESEEESEL